MSEKSGNSVFSVCMQICSDKQIYIENYRKLILYTNQEIIIDAKDCRVRILGNSLFMKYYSKFELIISGEIKELNFLK